MYYPIIFGDSCQTLGATQDDDLLCCVLQVIYTLLMPSQYNLTEETVLFTKAFIESGGVMLVLKALTQNDFMSGADNKSKR